MKSTIIFLFIVFEVQAQSRQVEPTDAIVISAGDSGDITQPDGPAGPSLIGSVDNIFKAVADYDQYRCIERMICEAMSEGTEIPGLDELVNTITGETGPSPGPSLASTFLGQNNRPLTSASTASSGSGLFSTLENLIFGSRRRSGPISQRPIRRPRPPPQSFRRPARPQRRPLRRQDHDQGFRPSPQIRTKRQTRLHGNIIRLMQATGADSFNAFPYVRAALIGHASSSGNRFSGNRVTRRGSACSQLFKDCPTDSDSLLNYLNNHNGGLFNQVQPTVDDEVGPIVQAIIADVVGGDNPETAASTAQDDSITNSDLFQVGDSLFTNAVINGATEFFTGDSQGTGGGLGLESIIDTILGKKKK